MILKINETFKETFASNEALDIVKEFSEIGIDSIVDDGLLKEIPIIGTLFSLYKIGANLKERHNIKKILIFLNKLGDIPVKERKKFLASLENDDKYREGVFEKTALLLERLDETHKAEMIGNLFKLYIMGVFDRAKFLRYSGIVERLMLADLLELHETSSFYFGDRLDQKPYALEPYLQTSLYSYGLMEQETVYKVSNISRGAGLTNPEPFVELKVSKLGEELADYILYDLTNENFLYHINYVIKFRN